ncbi:MAG: prepilin-type N-terminal cleavage/methylation domain-containing protein [Chitinivibrionales bacterium]|nr:prepilin-type N-terminal cleavage/methylation domain-containing protein [Chitinivibrionales bacterium]
MRCKNKNNYQNSPIFRRGVKMKFKALKKDAGFTLIEVIVVAVIIAVLSAVAIPLYNGYIRDSRRNTAENVAGSATSFIGTWYSMNSDLDGIDVDIDGASSGTLSENIGTWLWSDNEQKTTLISGEEGNENRFLIPTDIAIIVRGDSLLVRGTHVKAYEGEFSGSAAPDTIDVTQPYHYH